VQIVQHFTNRRARFSPNTKGGEENTPGDPGSLEMFLTEILRTNPPAPFSMRLVREPLEAAMQGLVENLWVFLWWNQESARKNGKEQVDQKGPVKMYFKSKDFDDALLWKMINIGGSKFRRPETLILSHPKPMALGHSLVN